jgi:hypothetical protein
MDPWVRRRKKAHDRNQQAARIEGIAVEGLSKGPKLVVVATLLDSVAQLLLFGKFGRAVDPIDVLDAILP